jgi:hypothetical protein
MATEQKRLSVKEMEVPGNFCSYRDWGRMDVKPTANKQPLIEFLVMYRFLASENWTFEDWRSRRRQQELRQMICGQVPPAKDKRTMHSFVIDSSE